MGITVWKKLALSYVLFAARISPLPKNWLPDRRCIFAINVSGWEPTSLNHKKWGPTQSGQYQILYQFIYSTPCVVLITFWNIKKFTSIRYLFRNFEFRFFLFVFNKSASSPACFNIALKSTVLLIGYGIRKEEFMSKILISSTRRE